MSRMIHAEFVMIGAITFAVSLTGCVSGPDAGSAVKPYRPVMTRALANESVRMPSLGILPKSRRDDDFGVSNQFASTNRLTTQVLEKGERVLRKGDKIQVTIYAPPEPFTCFHVVDEDGRLNIPLLGPMTVGGKSCGEAQRSIERAYIDQKIYKTVTVIIVPPEGEYTVSGEMIRPGPYPLTRDQTLLQALGRAGRYTEFADKSRVILTRGNERVEISLDDIRDGRRRDVVIIPGDVIEVPRSKW